MSRDGLKRKDPGELRVELYSGGREGERPRALHLEGRRVEVVTSTPLGRIREVLGEEKEVFLVETEEGKFYKLFHSLKEDRWSLIFVENS